MERCASVRKKGSLDQCPTRPVYGHTLCGRHARCKHPVLWADVHRTRHAGLIRAQALVRGFLLRRQLALGGPGVLSRKDLANDDDLATLTETARMCPFDYFGFAENGKTWAFEFPTLFAWVLRTATPVNPYTKVPLSTDVRKRLFRMWAYRVRHRRAPSLTMDARDQLRHTANYLAQIFVDNGFTDIGPQSFLDLPKSTWTQFFWTLQRDLIAMYAETHGLRRRGLTICRRMNFFIPHTTPSQYALIAQENLLRLLTYPRDPYLLCFTILSCFYRC